MSEIKRNGAFIATCALSLYLLQTLTSGTGPAMDSIMKAYPDVATTTVSLVTTFVSLFSAPTKLICGSLINKLGFKPTMYLGYVLAFVGGLYPAFFECSIYMLLGCRALVGLGYGIFMPMGASVVTAFFEGEKRAKYLGWGSSVAGISGMIISAVAGVLVSISVQRLWLFHLIMVIPFVFTIIMPTPDSFKSSNHQKKKLDLRLNGSTWFFTAIQGVVFMFFTTNLLYLSNIVVGAGYGTAADVGIMGTVGSIASFVSGITFVYIRKILKLRTLGVNIAFMGIAYLIILTSSSLIQTYVGIIIFYFTYMTFVTYCTSSLSISCKPSQMATAMGIGFTFTAIASTSAIYILNFIGQVFGHEDDFQFYYFVSAAIFLVLGVFLIVRPKKVKPALVEPSSSN